MRLKSLSLALGLLLMLSSGAANAAPINYIFTGTFDGSLNGTALSNQTFSVTITGDTANVTSGGGEFFNAATGTSFTVGATTGSFLGDLNEVVVNPSFGSGVGAIIFGQLVLSPPSFVGEGAVTGPLSTYDLTTALALSTGSVTQTPGSTYLTSAGDLVLTNISSISFEADLATPLPAALPMFMAAFAGLAFMGYRSRKAA